MDLQCDVTDLRVTRALALVASGYANPALNLSAIARAMNLSPGRASRLLKSQGLGFLDLLHAVRTRAAANLLRDRTLRVKEVSAAVGYTRTNELIRHFKKAYSTTPLAYRRLRSRQQAPGRTPDDRN